MTQPEAVEERQQGRTVEIAAPQLAAIQHSYEEARACIAGLAGSSSHAAQDGTDPHPDTEAIDIRLVKRLAVRQATPPTTAMSVAARSLAERPIIEALSRTGTSEPKPQRHTASCPGEDEMRASHLHTEVPGGAHRPRRWWRAVRTPLPRAVPAPR